VILTARLFVGLFFPWDAAAWFLGLDAAALGVLGLRIRWNGLEWTGS
jgi:hypothetical protein